MKKVLLLGAVCLTLSGCSGGTSAPSVHAAADTDMILHYGEREYACHVSYVNRNNASLTLSSPASLSGLTFRRTNGSDTLSLGTLLCKGGALLPTDGVPLREALAVFDSLSDPSVICTGQTPDGCYTFARSGDETLLLTTDSSGTPLQIKTDTLTLRQAPRAG